MKALSFLSLTALLLSAGPAVQAAEANTKVASPAAHPPAAKRGKTQGVVRTQKTRMGVRIAYTVDATSPGAACPVLLTVSRPDAGPALDIEFKADPALTLASGLPGDQVRQTQAQASYPLTVTPQGNGLHYLHVFLRQGGRAEALAIPVQVGKGSVVAKPSKAVTMPDGQRVISLPAQQ